LYRFYINDIDNDYHYSELARLFLTDRDFEVIPINAGSHIENHFPDNSYLLNALGNLDRDAIKREMYDLLSDITGVKPEWGTLTGVKPLKLAYNIFNDLRDIDTLKHALSREYRVSTGKADLLTDILEYQSKYIDKPAERSASIYAGIPFCPSRCSYCSFSSGIANFERLERYLRDLHTEIAYTGSILKDSFDRIESVYIGGGTPTTLSEDALKELINDLYLSFDIAPGSVEFSVEAGRPDTITDAKLKALKSSGVDRISINPQSLKDETLRKIGRNHSAAEIYEAFEKAGKYDFDCINADIIAGLPGETSIDFTSTLDGVIGLGPDNITIHTLSVKSGSELKEKDPEYYRRNIDTVSIMLDEAYRILRSNGYVPYYIYRQKHQIGSYENTGWCKPGKHSVYNIRIMEEKQTIIGLGAGAVGKKYYPAEDRLERIANVSNYEEYSSRLQEMLDRKHGYLK
jgi:coproporphyrinogen dehydrogenase HemZ